MALPASLTATGELPGQSGTPSEVAVARLLAWLDETASLVTMGWYGLGQPYWDGRPLVGRRILIRQFLGLGDTVLLLRYAPQVAAEREGRVVVEASGQLARLVRWIPGVDDVCAKTAAPVLPSVRFDTWVLAASLPGLFGATPGTIPTAPYIVPDPNDVATWRQRIGSGGSRLRVGLNWAGDPGNKTIVGRDIPLSELAPLGKVAGCTFFSLQKSVDWTGGWIQRHAGHEGDVAPDGLELTRLGPVFEDLADTAAAMLSLDLIITSDTSIAHLAGALGRPTWLLLPTPAYLFWEDSGGTSVWYPTLRIFRQERPGDWAPVIARVADALLRVVVGRLVA